MESGDVEQASIYSGSRSYYGYIIVHMLNANGTRASFSCGGTCAHDTRACLEEDESSVNHFKFVKSRHAQKRDVRVSIIIAEVTSSFSASQDTPALCRPDLYEPEMDDITASKPIL